MQHLFIPLLKQCRCLWMVKNCCYPQIWGFDNQFQPLLKKRLAEFVIFLFYFQNLTSLFIKSVYFILYFINTYNCFLLFFSSFGKFKEAKALPVLEAGVSLAFFGFFAWGVSEDWHLGAMLGKKAKNPSSQGKRKVQQAQRTLNIIFCFRKMLAFLFSCLSICSQEIESGRQTTHKSGLIVSSPSIGGWAGNRSRDQLGPAQHYLAGPLVSWVQG